MFLDQRPALHVVDKDTNFCAACFLTGETTKAMWAVYMDLWVCPYVGHPGILHVDSAPQLRSAAWKALTHSAGTQLVISGVKSLNELGSREGYHEYLKNVYSCIRLEHPGLSKESALALSCRGMNTTAGLTGLFPTLLVFGMISRTPVALLRLPPQRDRVQAFVTARLAMLSKFA
eukprot:contig_4190_g913